jgi:hypothetical protein
MRVLIQDAIEALILLLDEIDGDSDQEPIDEREDDPAECGIGDHGGLLEQIRADDSTRYVE